MSDRRDTGRAITAWLDLDTYGKAQQVALTYGLSLSALAAMALHDLIDEELRDSTPAFQQQIVQQARRQH